MQASVRQCPWDGLNVDNRGRFALSAARRSTRDSAGVSTNSPAVLPTSAVVPLPSASSSKRAGQASSGVQRVSYVEPIADREQASAVIRIGQGSGVTVKVIDSNRGTVFGGHGNPLREMASATANTGGWTAAKNPLR